MTNSEREELFVRAFITLDKQERYLQLLANPKRRSKVLHDFYHALPLILEYRSAIANRDSFPEELLKLKGAGSTCYLISPDKDIDQQEMPLYDALSILISGDRTAVVCCIPGQLAYYKAELSASLLERKLSKK